MSIKEHPPHHVPVLLESCLQLLNPQKDESYLDLTAGYGGHAKAFLGHTLNPSKAYLVDRDDYAISQLKPLEEAGAILIHDDFVTASKFIAAQEKRFDLVLVDLGVSSPQLDRADRGFSFTRLGPLDMRMDRRHSDTARDLINHSTVDELADIIKRYGEEPASVAKRYATAIKQAGDLQTTKDLADVILSVHRGKWSKTHPATRTFQALRIAVNDELGQVEKLLEILPQLVTAGGRVGIISFHSLEDRLVKQYFAEQTRAGYEAEFKLLSRKPHRGDIYDVSNPRARSATLRAAIKI